MAVSVFFSFHYRRDNWRVQQIFNMGALEGQPLLKPQDWESVKRKGEPAVERWIDDQMKYKRAVVVLVGAETASRRWVDYEIRKAWMDKRPLVGIRIHGLADNSNKQDIRGDDPFNKVTLTNGQTIGSYVSLFDPAGATSQQVHASIAGNLSSWVDAAYSRS